MRNLMIQRIFLYNAIHYQGKGVGRTAARRTAAGRTGAWRIAAGRTAAGRIAAGRTAAGRIAAGRIVVFSPSTV